MAINHELERIGVALRDPPAQFVIGKLHLNQSAPKPWGSHGPGSITLLRLAILISHRADVTFSRPV